MKVIQILQWGEGTPFALLTLTDTGKIFFGELNSDKSDEEALECDWREILPPPGCDESNE